MLQAFVCFTPQFTTFQPLRVKYGLGLSAYDPCMLCGCYVCNMGQRTSQWESPHGVACSLAGLCWPDLTVTPDELANVKLCAAAGAG